VAGHRITVSEKDGRRVARLLVARQAPPADQAEAGLPE
jgi:hypothetical protein